jgi:hypothetical protein
MSTLTISLARAIEAAQKATGRTGVLFSPPSSAELCQQLALTSERLAAVVFEGVAQVTPLMRRHARQVRALSSAEGALLISLGNHPELEAELQPDLRVTGAL